MRRRKNLFLILLMTIVFLGAWLYILLYVPPGSHLTVAIFHLSLFLALFFTLSLLFGNSRWGFLLAGGVVVYFLLRLLKIAHFINIILLLSLLLTLEVYFRRQ